MKTPAFVQNILTTIDARIEAEVERRVSEALDARMADIESTVAESSEVQYAIERAIEEVDVEPAIDAYFSYSFDLTQYVDVEDLVADAVADISGRVDDLEAQAHEHDD